MQCVKPFYLDDVRDCTGERIPIPCGKCIACRINRQSELCDRMLCAYQSHSTSAFVTFTYDDDHLPMSLRSDVPRATLQRDDFRKYIDKIRHMVDVKFEYFACGEYGDKFSRPHYHVLFFGLDYQLYGKFFETSWKFGSVKVLPCSAQVFRYCAKYITQSPDADTFLDFGVEPAFSSMSRGLGFEMYSRHFDEIRLNGFFYLGNKKISIPRYYFNKLCRFDSRFIDMHENSVLDSKRKARFCAGVAGLSLSEFNDLNRKNLELNLVSREIKNGK